MKTIISNLDTCLTIDTYQMFTGENVVEMETEYQRDECGNDDPDFEFNHPKIVKGLATESMGYLENEVRDLGIIKSLRLIDTHSPQWYNYTTDSYRMEIDFNVKPLVSWLRKNNLLSEVAALENEWWCESYTRHEPYLVTFLNNVIDPDQYNMHMWEQETEIYLNNMQVLES